jgi:hypothetical protein
MVKWDDAIYNIPAYPVTDAARYLRIPLVTLRSWLKGRSYATKNGQQTFEPLIERPDLGITPTLIYKSNRGSRPANHPRNLSGQAR